jgi:hypothetical protein
MNDLANAHALDPELKVSAVDGIAIAEQPTAAWAAQQIVHAFPDETGLAYLSGNICRCGMPGQKLDVRKPDVEFRLALHSSPLGAAMILVLGVWTLLRALLGRSTAVTLENVALRHQLMVLQRSIPRPRLRRQDRIFWVCFLRLWGNWRSSLLIVQPATVVAWHRQGFRLYWRWKSRLRSPGRPPIDLEIRTLIRRMARATPPGAGAGARLPHWRKSPARAERIPASGNVDIGHGNGLHSPRRLEKESRFG